jgi:HPt (histidine-containing phosphotransfer) domain-containing protein
MARLERKDGLIEVAGEGAQWLAAAYLERRKEQIVTLRRALDARDFEALWIAGHRMHGSGAPHGVPRISELGAALEISAFQRDIPRIAADIDRLESFLRQVEVVTAGD